MTDFPNGLSTARTSSQQRHVWFQSPTGWARPGITAQNRVRGEAEAERLREVRSSLLIIVLHQQNVSVSIFILQAIVLSVSV